MACNNVNTDIETQIINYWHSLPHVPSIIIFDLDYTLWPYFMDQHVKPPITSRKSKSDIVEIVDRYGKAKTAYQDVTIILKTLKEKCLGENGHLCIASKSTTYDLAMTGIEMYEWKSYLSSFQIYPSNKKLHMNNIKKELGFESFTEVLFFDDCQSNIVATSGLGLVSFLVSRETGLNMNALQKGLAAYNCKIKNSSKSKRCSFH